MQRSYSETEHTRGRSSIREELPVAGIRAKKMPESLADTGSDVESILFLFFAAQLVSIPLSHTENSEI